jgi:2,4-dienoyl-CoA reductase-like NADH-dependent reductase (Old Yellow Enzyme family)/thioredoxin reductase
MGRRQFLAGAVATSAMGLASRKITRGIVRGNGAGLAQAAGTSDGGGSDGIFSDRYRHLLSPLKIGNVVLKSRMMGTRALPHFMQGPETFPSEAVISYYAGIARNGAAIVTTLAARDRDRSKMKGFLAHPMIWNIDDPSVQNYFSQLADAIHFYDSLASVGLNMNAPSGYNISSAKVPHAIGRDSSAKEIPAELIQEMIENSVNQARIYQGLGFDMVNIYMPYNASMLSHSLSPVRNKRTDRYGGSLENRARFPLELFQAIKKACGPDFLIEAHMSGEEGPGGYTIKDTIEYAKIWEGALDILQLRQGDKDDSHPMGWNAGRNEHVTLGYAEAIKKSGVEIAVAPNGGYQDLDLNESYIKEGKADIIAMARTWIADPEYGQKAYEGRGEDVVPCIRCNKCHGDSSTGPWFDFCSVNPKMGHAHRMIRMIDPPTSPKTVAVIGGGPAGMRAALVAAERGHRVTLYEMSSQLGGLLKHADHTPYSWPLKEFKDYLVYQMGKAGVEVFTRTEASPEMIASKGYDAVIAALGSEPIMPRIPGSDGVNVYNIIDVFRKEKELGKEVVVIGGGRLGTEAGMFLANAGHNATVLTSGDVLVPSEGPHQIQVLVKAYQELQQFSGITGVVATGITKNVVTYTDADGSKKSIKADSVVIYAGRRAKKDLALKYYHTAKRFFIIGDCLEVATIHKCNRTAFAAASQI